MGINAAHNRHAYKYYMCDSPGQKSNIIPFGIYHIRTTLAQNLR